jgi:hypothetical protein
VGREENVEQSRENREVFKDVMGRVKVKEAMQKYHK